eukprot:1112238-Rhodomonas_salina.1
MIATKTVPAHLKHIRKLRDLFALELTENPNYNDKKAAMQSINTGADDRFICPITQRPANGRNPFLVYRGCGHVVSEQAHKQVGGSTCVVCARSVHHNLLLFFASRTSSCIVRFARIRTRTTCFRPVLTACTGLAMPRADAAVCCHRRAFTPAEVQQLSYRAMR